MIESSVPRERAVHDRALRGLEAFRDGCVGWRGGWVVAGSAGALYRVSLSDRSCECPDFEHHGGPCKHVYAAEIARAKTRRCSGCGEPFPRRELIELHGGDDPFGNHDGPTYFDGDRLCGGCADGAGVIR